MSILSQIAITQAAALASATLGRFDYFVDSADFKLKAYDDTNLLVSNISAVSANGVGYTLTVPSDWDGTPAQAQAALDELASRVKVIEGGTPQQDINNSLSSGLNEGGQLVAGTANTQYSITDGSGLIIDSWTDPINPVAYPVSWTGKTDITPTNIGTQTVTFVFIDKNGNVVETNSTPTPQNIRDYIYLGQLGHANKSTINAFVSTPSVLISPISQLRDLYLGVGVINEDNIITANGANLSIDKGNGYLIGLGVGFFTDTKSPNRQNYPAQILATIRRRTQTGGSGTSTTIDPLNYDLAGVVTPIAGTKTQNQRVYLLSSGNIVVQYGQTLYNSVSEATQGLSSESFIQLENTKQGLLIAVITVQSNCVDLTNTTRARILNLGKFGQISDGVSGLSVSTLQQAYNNSTTPEIVTDATRGAVDFKRGSAADTDTVVVVQNGAGTTTFSITGEGNVTTNLVDGRDISVDGAKLDGIEPGATADQTPAEIETAYNTQVSIVSQAEAEAGVSTTVRRWTAERVKQAIAALATGGSACVSSFPISDTDAGSATTGVAFAILVTPPTDITATSMAYHVTSANVGRTVYVGIYDAAGTTKLVEGSGNADAVGKRTASIASTTLTGGTDYWFVILEGNGSPNFASKTVFGDNARIAKSKFISVTPTGLPAVITDFTNTTTAFYIAAKG